MGKPLPRASNRPNPAEKVMMPDYPRPPFASRRQPMPGTTRRDAAAAGSWREVLQSSLKMTRFPSWPGFVPGYPRFLLR